MQVAILSDIHANLQAWNAVLLDARSLDVDTMFCLGDIVGYGPNPAEVLSSVHANVEHLVLGNHDAVVCGKLKADLFNDSAADLIRWTGTQLNNKAVNFLADLPLTIDCGDFRCCHGDMCDPSAFNYISEAEDAADSWQHVKGNLFFVGHTHEPAIFILGESGIPRTVEPQDFIVEDSRRYVVNPGSVGQPRDGHALASYCIFDTDTRSIFWRRVPFDIDEYCKAVSAAGLDESVNWFLNFDPRNRTATARDYADFSPATQAADKATQVVEVKQFDLLASRARRWKASFTIALTALILLLGSAATMGFLPATKEVIVPASAPLPSRGPLLADLKIDATPYLPLSDYTLHIGNKRRQTVSISDYAEDGLLCIESTSDAPVILITPPIPAKHGEKLSFELLLRKSSEFSGSAVAFISLTKEVDGVREESRRYLIKEPNMQRKGGFRLAKQTVTLPANTTHVSFGLSAEFSGTLEVAMLRLERKD